MDRRTDMKKLISRFSQIFANPGFVMHKGIPIAIVRLRRKNCKTIRTNSS